MAMGMLTGPRPGMVMPPETIAGCGSRAARSISRGSTRRGSISGIRVPHCLQGEGSYARPVTASTRRTAPKMRYQPALSDMLHIMTFIRGCLMLLCITAGTAWADQTSSPMPQAGDELATFGIALEAPQGWHRIWEGRSNMVARWADSPETAR